MCLYPILDPTKVELTPHSLPLDLLRRVEYLTLALANAKSHAASEYSRLESAVEFLKDLEDSRDTANVQLEIHQEVLNLMARAEGLSPTENPLNNNNWGGLEKLENNLLTMTEVGTASLFLDWSHSPHHSSYTRNMPSHSTCLV